MANDSSTGGPLVPGSQITPPLEGASFEDFLQAVIVSLTGLPGAQVIPRWQPEPPDLPPRDSTGEGVDWVAYGIQEEYPDTYAAIVHHPSVGPAPGYDEMQRHETVDLLLSFYGPDADLYTGLFRDGLQIPQNREIFQLNAMGLVDTGRAINVPEMIKGKWWKRLDMTWTLRRQIRRSYPILDLLSAGGSIVVDQPPLTIPISVSHP